MYPTNCKCGRMFLEKYEFKVPTKDGAIGFCWCGWCRTKVMVKKHHPAAEKGEAGQ